MATAQDEFNELMRDKDRRTTHPEDDGIDAQSFLNLSDSASETTQPDPAVDPDDAFETSRTSNARTTIPLTRYAANTGPKGVIADAQNFRDSQRLHRMSMRTTSNLPAKPTGRLEQEALSIEQIDGQDADEEEDSIDDNDFMAKWRTNRLNELQKGVHDNRIYNKHHKKRMWGGLTTVDGNGYLNAVDNSPSDTVVLVYIYDDESEVSIYIEDCVRTLAQKHLDVRFIKLHFQDAEMEPAGVPALLAYRGGDKFAGLVPIIQEIPDEDELSASTLEIVLKRHQILR